MPVYFNTKTGATIDIKDSEFKKLKPEDQKRWRAASPSELKIHEKRVADKKMLSDKEAERVKAKVKADKEKAKRYAKLAPKADTKSEKIKEGSTDEAESAEPKI